MATKDATLPQFEATALDLIPKVASAARGTFRTHKTKKVQWRIVQLRKLYWAIEDFRPRLIAALMHDLHKSVFEAVLTEIDWLLKDCMFMIKHLNDFTKDEKLGSPAVPITYSMMNFRTRKEPLGAVLIIGPYNYPLQLLLAPLIGAIGAGCTAVLKPSELTTACAMVVKEMVETRLDRSAFAVVNGAIPETNALLAEKWDKIFFTGSDVVGKIVAKKAAETLTPVCLELGGKNPAFVTKNANLALAARRLLWGKTHNSGQVCMSQNYVLIDKQVVPAFTKFLKVAYKDMFPDGAKASPDLGRIVNARHFHRIKKMLDDTKGKIVMGGEVDEAELYIEPTAVLVNSTDDSMIKEESFGPIFALYPVNSLDEALNVAASVHRTPLSLYTFGSKSENERVLNEMTSGGATLNDSFFHGSVNTVPFGGVGDSGWGSYRGKASFDCFTHFRTIAETPSWADKILRVRYMPYDMSKMRLLARLTAPKPNFDRSGSIVRGFSYWVKLIFGLGASSAKGALFRWLLLLAVNYVLKASLAAR
ncbi:Aldehyde/histidinol dehydrogenase [Lasiosphaeria miniovina]|uniref:Aldehyde dehydrogenase n=1 Tax=Lasiosphaeria miniovina TaxID=1954250 RepID=A0AA40BFJ6_9PEZI|nr:Aldehyde/histidinol dehydrogenase [Lasiosphaeria miniovina]KAK0733271.1 Aldehyde/histidinol dehydrogenase [Lasiosphaeria miniovina]